MNNRPLDLDELTPGEKTRLAWLTARMCKSSLAGPNDTLHRLEREADRIFDRARKRTDRKRK